MEDQTDEEIIILCKEGERDAFRFLIDRYTSPIYNFTARLAGHENAPDLVQEVFIKAWKKINNFDISKASFKTWLFAIARNTTYDFLRKKKSLNFSDLEKYENDISFIETIPDEKLLPDEVLQKLQDTELLNKLLDKLSILDKEILTLHYQEDLTFNEISKILKKPLNTIKSNHHRALIKLRGFIK